MPRRSSLPALLTSILAVLSAPTVAPAQDASSSSQAEINKDLVRRFTEVSNATDWDALRDIVTDDFRRHSSATEGPPVTSRDAFIALQKSFLVSFPDQRVTIEQMVAEGDRVAILARYTATHTGPMGDIPATGRPVDGPFLAIFRIDDGRIAEMWVEWDNVAMLKQLGLFPPPGTPSP
jgi:steroid delta-isomerase-like uncharacterized protein